MTTIQKAALLYLLAVVLFFYGYSVARFQVPPYAFLESVVGDFEAFAQGDELEKESSLFEKLQNDMGLTPHRFIYPIPPGLDKRHSALQTPGLKKRRESPQVYIDPQHREGYRVFVGAFDFEASFWGGILMNPAGEVVHTWHLSTEHLPTNTEPDLLKNLYGLHLDPDGSITFTMQEEGGGIVKADVCSQEIWNLRGSFHHTVSDSGNGTYWAYIGSQVRFDQDMVEIDADTGKVLRRIDMTRVRKANPHVKIWDFMLPHFSASYANRFRDGNMTHGNDIEPLPAELAGQFPQFRVGDLLISYAASNLVFVLDPDTLKVKWWRVGVSEAQHDPDWEQDGRIHIYSNERRVEDEFSKIVAIDPKNYEWEVTFDGKTHFFKSPGNGRHQGTNFGTRMITSATQGWAFEVDDAGKTVFSFLNTWNKGNNEVLHMSEAFRLADDFFEGKPWERCGDPASR